MNWVRNISAASIIIILVLVIKLLILKPSPNSKIDYSNARNKKDSIEAFIRANPQYIDTLSNSFIIGHKDLCRIITIDISIGTKRNSLDTAINSWNKDWANLPYTIKERIFTILEQGAKK